MKIPAFRDSGVSAVFLQKADIFPVPGHLQKLIPVINNLVDIVKIAFGIHVSHLIRPGHVVHGQILFRIDLGRLLKHFEGIVELLLGLINLAKMSIKAPFYGVISELPKFTDGTRVASNTLMVKLVDYSRLYLEANLPEKYYTNVKPGFKVYITSYTSPQDTLIGEITQISPAIDPDARTFLCYVNVDNKDRILLPGMFVKADMVVNSSENTIVIPKDIIVTRNRVRTVFVVERGVAHERRITTGLETAERVEVLTGIEPGESLVSKGFETLRDNSRVKVLR